MEPMVETPSPMTLKRKPRHKAQAPLMAPSLSPSALVPPLVLATESSAVAPTGAGVAAMQVDAPPPHGLMPPCNAYYLPPFEIPPSYRPISRSFLATHPLHLAIQRADGGDTWSLLVWHTAGLEVGILASHLGNFLKEYHVQVELICTTP